MRRRFFSFLVEAVHADRPSLTAIKVARGLLLLDAQPELAGVIPRDMVADTRALLEAAGLFPSWQARLIASRRMQRLSQLIDSVGGRQLLMVALRKRFLDEETRAAIADGARQLLVVGAGLDTLALRMAEAHPKLQAVEIDHPATAAVKARALRRLGREPDNLHLVRADLSRQRLGRAIDGVQSYDRTAPAVVIAEGLLMYLREADVKTLFSALHACTGKGSRVLFTYIEEASFGVRIGRLRRLTELAFRAIGEDLLFTIAETELGEFLSPLGWTYASDDARYDLGRRYLPDPTGPRVGLEHAAVAHRA